MFNLFIDDERFPPNDGRDWKIARNFTDVFELIKEQGRFPDYISFDHDLGENEKTGFDIAKFLVEIDLMDSDVHPKRTFSLFAEIFSFYVHSQNPVGKRNIESYLNSYLDHIRIDRIK